MPSQQTWSRGEASHLVRVSVAHGAHAAVRACFIVGTESSDDLVGTIRATTRPPHPYYSIPPPVHDSNSQRRLGDAQVEAHATEGEKDQQHDASCHHREWAGRSVLLRTLEYSWHEDTASNYCMPKQHSHNVGWSADESTEQVKPDITKHTPFTNGKSAKEQ
jgi:hypothetical protein